MSKHVLPWTENKYKRAKAHIIASGLRKGMSYKAAENMAYGTITKNFGYMNTATRRKHGVIKRESAYGRKNEALLDRVRTFLSEMKEF
jgi:hypothetical protein